MLEEERNFVNWVRQLGIPELELDDYTELDSEETKALQRRVGLSISDAPPDFRLRWKERNVDFPLCWVDVKRPWTERDTYNLNCEKYKVYKAVAKADECPLYLVFYGSANQIIGWAELEYTNSRFSNRRIKVNKDTPFDQEIKKLMAKRIRRSSQGF